MTVLILAHEVDATADRVAVELASRGVPVVHVDPAHFPTKVSFTGHISNDSPWSGRITSVGRGSLVALADVTSVYYRHPTQFQLAEGMSGPEQVFAYGEARRGFGGVVQALDGCLWVNDPITAARCEYKPIQLAAAVSVGLNIPETIITNDPRRAHEWASRLGQPIVYKPLSGVWHADEGQLRVLYTSPVTNPDDLLNPALSLTAHLFQAQIDKQREARAVVVGDQVFTVAIDADSEAGRIDWRSDYACHTYEVIELPNPVRDKLVALHRRLGLVFGAVDLIYDTTNRWIFLETNQGGEWGWLAEETEIPIAAAIAHVLEEGHQ